MAFSENPPLPSTDWDVLISGSGIKQSLLAVALGRAGKTVLQIDRNSYYGGSSTAFYSLPEIDTWASRVNNGLEPGFSDAVVVRGEGAEKGRGYTVSLSPDLVYWHSALLRLLRSADMTDSFSWQAVGSWWVWLTDEDVAVPAASTGGGAAVLRDVGVKAVKAAAAGKKKWNKGRKKATEDVVNVDDPAASSAPPQEVEAATTLRRIGGNFREVACTFEDVAWSKDLTDRDRGYLGEFLRFVMKHDSKEPGDQKYRDIFTENKTNSLHSLLSTNFPLPPSAITSLSSLTLLPNPPTKTPVELAVPRLARHFSSLGNIPDVRSAAALTIAYGGSAELCQVFSRAAAVAGGVNVLGRGIKSIGKPEETGEIPAEKLGETELAGEKTETAKRALKVDLDNGETINVDWVIGSEGDLCPSQESSQQVTNSMARAAYIISGDLPALFEKKYKDESTTPAAAIIMVPSSTADGDPVYVIARSSITGECPRGQTLLYASTALPLQPGYDAIALAVERLLENQPDPPKVLLSLFYTTTTSEPRAATEGGLIHLHPVGLGVVFEDDVVEEAMGVYERVMGTREGFMRLPDEARRLMDEMEEE